MHTVLEILNLSIDYLRKMNIESPRRQAEELIGEALGIGRTGVYLEFDRPLMTDELDRCRSWLKRRASGEPLQYISGTVKFFNCELKVTRDVLIPRQETEILVEKIVNALKKMDLSGKILWDICCGSGSIAIALKKQFPELTVAASDLSSAALKIAIENASANEVSSIEFLEGDLFAPFINRKADFIVCNPPYIAEKEFATLDPEVRLYEPKSALISGASGIEIYQRLKGELPLMLNPGGKVWLEIGATQGESIKNLFTDSKWVRSQLESDWAGHDRFFSLELE